jgi:hypothetical protein
VGPGHQNLAVGSGNRVAVRITAGVAKFGSNPLNERVRDSVLQQFGFIVDFVPAVTQLLHQVRFDQPVAPDHGQGQAQAGVGQCDGTVRFMVNKALVLELADHLRHRRVGHPQPLGKLRGRDGLVLPFSE